MTPTIYQTTVPQIPLPVVKKWRSLINIFHNEREEPYGNLLTPTQLQIVDIIAKRRYPRTQIILPTQYGKSLSVALGVLLRVTTKKEKWAIVAPTEDKARIIMDYIIEHIFDDERFIALLEYNGTKESLLRERSKTRITFRGKGEVRVYTASANNTQQVKKALMGFGAPNVILDESVLINDDLYATVKRMIGGTKDNFLLEIGNPFFRNHFYRTWTGDRYKKIFVDVWQALKEGRYTEEYVKEMQEEAMFDVLYECLFPQENEVLPNGYRRLLLDSAIENAMLLETPPQPLEDDKPILGVDPAHGGANRTVMTVRYPKSGFAYKWGEFDYDDTEDVVSEIVKAIRELNIGDYRTAVDAGGVGAGVADSLKKLGYLIKAVQFGEKSSNQQVYANRRAELYWKLRNWVRNGGLLVKDSGFLELGVIHFKENASYKLQIEPKEEMAKRDIASPDTADSLALTMIDTSTIVEEDDIDAGEYENPVEKMDKNMQVDTKEQDDGIILEDDDDDI